MVYSFESRETNNPSTVVGPPPKAMFLPPAEYDIPVVLVEAIVEQVQEGQPEPASCGPTQESRPHSGGLAHDQDFPAVQICRPRAPLGRPITSRSVLSSKGLEVGEPIAERSTGPLVDRVLGIVAGALGILAVFLPWVTVPPLSFNLLQLLDLTNLLSNLGISGSQQLVAATALLALCLILLVVGSLISFFRRGGGIVILVAWLLFLVGFYAFLPSELRVFLSFGAGFYAALIAGIVALSRYGRKSAQRPMEVPTQPLFTPEVPRAASPEGQVEESEVPPPPPPEEP